MEYLFLELIPLKNKYKDKIPKNNPKGSDLNQPICPRTIIGKAIENNKNTMTALKGDF